MIQPTIAVTMGDPAGIGPEIVVRALGEGEVQAACRPVVVGDPRILARAAELVKSPQGVRPVPTARGTGADPRWLEVLPAGEVDPTTLRPGTLDARWASRQRNASSAPSRPPRTERYPGSSPPP